MSMPTESHWRKATCEEVDCEAFRFGWVTTVDLATELGQRQHHYITGDRTRSCTRSQAATLVSFTYPPGMRCFDSDSHRLPVERPSIFTVRDGDWRGNPTGDARVHANAEDWVDDFANRADRLATEIQKG
jgi:hypothetical protein